MSPDAPTLDRRSFLRAAPFLPPALASALASGCQSSPSPRPPAHLLFTSAGRTCLIHPDGSGFRPLTLQAPGQVTWQPAGSLPDGRLLLLSMEARRDGPGRPFDQFYHQTPTHVWAHDLDSGELQELATRERRAPFYTPQLVLPSGRILMQVIRERPGQILNMNLDGSDAREFTGNDEGLPYGFSLQPGGERVAFHLASPRGYEIWTSDPLGRDRIRIAGQSGHLFFGPVWSPDGRFLAFQDCLQARDPGHDWSDVCIARPDGSDLTRLTSGQAMWFAATYGPAGRHGGGSNILAWSNDNRLLFPERLPDSRVPWQYRPDRPDTDHFNRDFNPDQARGGTRIRSLDPVTGSSTLLAPADPVAWDFRCTPSPDGRWLAFCRARTGGSPGLWILRRGEVHPRLLSLGLDDAGADHPRWA